MKTKAEKDLADFAVPRRDRTVEDVFVNQLVHAAVVVYDRTCPGLSRGARIRREKFEERLREALVPIVYARSKP